MGSEYVGLTKDEKKYSEKSLLTTQMNSLTALQHMKKYHSLRKQEFTLKIQLKTKLAELYSELSMLDKLLPHSSFIKEKETKVKEVIEEEDELVMSIHSAEKAKENEISQQLEEIKSKLDMLK